MSSGTRRGVVAEKTAVSKRGCKLLLLLMVVVIMVILLYIVMVIVGSLVMVVEILVTTSQIVSLPRRGRRVCGPVGTAVLLLVSAIKKIGCDNRGRQGTSRRNPCCRISISTIICFNTSCSTTIIGSPSSTTASTTVVIGTGAVKSDKT